MRRTATAIAALAALLALGACGSGGTDTSKADTEPTASTPETSKNPYTIENCKAILEESYTEDSPRDLSSEPECAGFTNDEYQQAVKDVLAGHVDDILDDAATESYYDEGWESLDADGQQTTCELLKSDGPDAVGDLLDSLLDDPSLDGQEMAEYLLAEKC
ncbi:hypothetical protein [Streptomyces stelliscabiei]|uniref:ABC-type glycerol-3-phosphate transport system substrate-binding protein n=1 Tax=Streptomyces stelliscabiei TaxID=146820 RepID=A0A8I0PC42_9ACTN|nr:hypothetical protein [Streptomyces stelliscabiei]KND29928.1 hypothetical protein IQ64_41665 [Streptomyces stelliscabiei]MBE1598968.1 ABC-type glycerol-3-phosphate transport system substrate-binding protein [Streptomyces stelliscabiei]